LSHGQVCFYHKWNKINQQQTTIKHHGGAIMSGFTKLVPEIVQSSIWNESAEVRCVWIAMLAIKDKDGNIRGNAATIARIANVRIESAREALEKFQQPDPDSNTPDKDGRRIEPVPGGWHVVNHAVYRGKDYREAEAERKRLYRQKKEMSGTCPGQVPDTSVSVSVSASFSAQEGGCKGETKATIKDDLYRADFEEAWKAYPDKSGKTKALEAYRKHRADGDTQPDILAGIERYRLYVTAKRANGQDLGWRNGQTFFNQANWRDEWVVAALPPVLAQTKKPADAQKTQVFKK
jgi:hypothetical protein